MSHKTDERLALSGRTGGGREDLRRQAELLLEALEQVATNQFL